MATTKLKQIDVTIMGQTYVLGCPPGGDVALLEAVSTVDREMTTIKEAGRVKARERIAVLAALNLAYALAGRPTPEAAPVVGTSPAPSAAVADASTGHSDAGPLGVADSEAIEALLRRVDRAIADDDRLL